MTDAKRTWIKACALPGGSGDLMMKIKAGNKNILIIRRQGEYFATAARCPHAGADLSLGWCEGRELICSYHRYRYNLDTGRGAPGQGDYIDTWPVEVREDGLYVGFSKGFSLFNWMFGQ